VAGAGRDHHDVAGLDLIGDAILNLRAVVAGPLNSLTVRMVAGRRCRFRMSGPSTNVAEPEIT